MRGSIAIFALCATLSACGGETNDGLDDTALRAQVRVIQAVVDAPALDVYVLASARLPAFPNVASGNATGYVGLDKGNDYQFIVRQPGDPDILAQLDLPLGESERKLLLISGARTPAEGEQPITIAAFDDTFVDPGPGKTRLRVVNATVEGEAFPLVVAGTTLGSPPANEEVLLTVDAGVALSITAGPSTFTTPPLPPSSDVTIAVIGSPDADEGEARALRLLNVPAVGISNTTATSTTARNPFVVFVNAVSGGAGALAVDGGAATTLPFSAVSPLMQVSATPTVRLDGQTATLSGALDPAATYLVVIVPSPIGGGITLFAYRDALADSAETRVTAINATKGSGARDIALSPAPVLGNDLVVGAASASSGTLVADPTSVTAITATPTAGAPFVYTTGITAATRYLVLVGDAASAHGVLIISADWSATFVAAD